MSAETNTRILRYLGVACGIIGLLCVRAFEHHFYDPLMVYFKNDYLTDALPDYDPLLLFLNWTLRYLINSALSLGVIFCLFPQSRLLRICVWIFAGFLVLLLISLGMLLAFNPENRFFLFYLRRFLIQPILLLVLLPALYYQKISGLKNR